MKIVIISIITIATLLVTIYWTIFKWFPLVETKEAKAEWFNPTRDSTGYGIVRWIIPIVCLWPIAVCHILLYVLYYLFRKLILRDWKYKFIKDSEKPRNVKNLKWANDNALKERREYIALNGFDKKSTWKDKWI